MENKYNGKAFTVSSSATNLVKLVQGPCTGSLSLWETQCVPSDAHPHLAGGTEEPRSYICLFSFTPPNFHHLLLPQRHFPLSFWWISRFSLFVWRFLSLYLWFQVRWIMTYFADRYILQIGAFSFCYLGTFSPFLSWTAALLSPTYRSEAITSICTGSCAAPHHEHKADASPLLCGWSLSCASCPHLVLLYRCFSPFPLLFPPCKLDPGSIPALFSSFPSLWPNYLVFQVQWPWLTGCSATGGLHKHQNCLSAKTGQRNGFCSTANTTLGRLMTACSILYTVTEFLVRGRSKCGTSFCNQISVLQTSKVPVSDARRPRRFHESASLSPKCMRANVNNRIL